jgi:hypothetical protein
MFPTTQQRIADFRVKVNNFISALKNKAETTTAYHFPKALFEEGVETGEEMVKSMVRSPFRIQQTASDVGRQIMGKRPSEGYDLPGLGRIEGYGRQFEREFEEQGSEWNMGTIASAIKIASQGILDAATLGKVLKGLNNVKFSNLPNQQGGFVKVVGAKEGATQADMIKNKTLGMEKQYIDIGALKKDEILPKEQFKRMIEDVANNLGAKGQSFIQSFDLNNPTNIKTIFDRAMNFVSKTGATTPLTLAIGAGGSIVGMKKVYDFFGLPTEWTKNLAEEVKNNFPFEKEALERLNEVNYKQSSFANEPEESKGVYIMRGGEIEKLARVFGFSEKTAEKIADFPISQYLDKPTIKIKKDLQAPLGLVVTHEMLHHISMTKDKEENYKFLEDFWYSWNDLIDSSPEKSSILKEIDKKIKEVSYSDEPYVISNERFAFLGQEVIDKGYEIIPEDLRDFYKGVIKMPNRNQ